MGEEPRDIQERIEQTREQMGETVEALASKADVPGRVKGAVAEKKDAAIGKIVGAKEAIAGGASSTADATGGATAQAANTVRRGAGMAQENPLGLAIGAVAAGFVVGMLIPSTRVENERLGPVADTVKEQAREAGSEAADHAKQVVQDVAQAATETAKEAGQQHADALRDSVTSTSG
jgi:gas vesicle protein